MGYYEPDCDYYEPSEFEEECEHLKDLIKQSAYRELKQENEKLKKEIEESREIVSNLKQLQKEAENMKRRYEYNENLLKDKIEKELKQAILDSFFDSISSELYTVTYKSYQPPKCDMCNKDRKIMIISPVTGNTLYEDCSCGKYRREWTVRRCCYKRASYRNKEFNLYIENNDGFYVSIIDLTIYDKNMKYEDINKYNIYFKTEEECQKYANWLNEQEDKNEK